MRKFLFAAIILILALTIIFVIKKSGKTGEPNVKPEILNITTSQATVVWLSKGKYKGSVSYMALNDAAPMTASETFGSSDQHEVTLAGLRPSIRYMYWLDNSPTHYQFETQPAPNNPFSFLVTWGDISDRIVSLLRSESGEFIISLTPETKADWFADVRPYVPVFGISGIDSPFLKTVGSLPKTENLWKLDWGGLRLIFINNASDLENISEMLNAPAAHTIGIITSAELVAQTPQNSKLQSMLVIHNKQQPTRPAAFVALTGTSKDSSDVNGVQYFGIDTQKSSAIRVDIDVESARAVFLDENREVALKQPPLKQKRTCEECRRLADKGAYEESVKAYLDFIETHKGDFQIDDAYFSIAEIYDSKLFEFKKAIDWYRRLIAEYPNGTFTSLADQRIRYISAYSDDNYKPLTVFERIKAIEYARKKDQPNEREKIFENVKAVINQYPDSNLAPVMQHWLANQYRLYDADKAVNAYKLLKEKYAKSPESQEVDIEIGETYYDGGRYNEALAAYKQALQELPGMADTIQTQIERSERNLRRDKIAYVCWAIVAIIGGAAFMQKPRIQISRAIWAFCAMIIVGIALFFFGWLVHEEFNSVREMILLICSFALISCLSAMVAIKFTGKARSEGSLVLSAVGGSLGAILFFLAAVFLAVYYIYVHYLIIVKL